MQSQFGLLGAFVATIAAWFVCSLAVFVPADALLTWRGFYPLFPARTTRPLRAFRFIRVKRITSGHSASFRS
jgi:hypothetical protein